MCLCAKPTDSPSAGLVATSGKQSIDSRPSQPGPCLGSESQLVTQVSPAGPCSVQHAGQGRNQRPTWSQAVAWPFLWVPESARFLVACVSPGLVFGNGRLRRLPPVPGPPCLGSPESARRAGLGFVLCRLMSARDLFRVRVARVSRVCTCLTRRS